jgi:hypothetical protein
MTRKKKHVLVKDVCSLREILEGRDNRTTKDTVKMLIRFDLIQPDGGINASVKNVVLSSLAGANLNTRLVLPIARSNSAPAQIPNTQIMPG